MADHVLIAIPTFRRPKSLARLLRALSSLETSAEIEILVADNDSEKQQGFCLCMNLASTYRWPLRAVIVPERGISHARNRLVAEALARPRTDFIAMIDDDEWPEPGWIDAFVELQHQTGADALQGSIIFADKSGGTADICRPTGITPMLQGAGNLFVRRSLLAETAQPWFDPAFALSGGEDRDFFVRLEQQGARFAWADEARAHGDVPESRATLAWSLRRAYSTGNSDMRVLLKHNPGGRTCLIEASKIAASLLLSLPLAVILAPSPNRRGPLTRLFRAAGKLTAMLGLRYNEYAVVHGE